MLDDAMLLASELVTNAVLHAGTGIEVVCRFEAGDSLTDASDVGGPLTGPFTGPVPGLDGPDEPVRESVVIEVVDLNPTGVVDGGRKAGRRGRGLQLVAALAESWGVTYHHTRKAVWFRLDDMAPDLGAGARSASLGAVAGDPETEGLARGAPRPDPGSAEPLVPAPPGVRHERSTEWAARGGPSFLAEASELLSGQLDEHMVAALAGQLLVPRLADWCAVWLTTENGELRLSRVWHTDERLIGALRVVLENDPPPAGTGVSGLPWPWPEIADPQGVGGSALAFPLVAGGRGYGMLLLGRAGVSRMTEGVVRLVGDVARRVAQAVATARQYTQQATISRALQSRQLPASLARIPGVDTAVVYEPHGEGQTVGGDFYDLFPMGGSRWCFLLGDVCGSDPEAMSVTGLARHLVRLLAREGHGVESVLGRLNLALAEESAEAVALGGEQDRPRFLSLLYGELEPDPDAGCVHCTLASAGHPLPLRLSANGAVAPAAGPQMLLGIDEETEFHADTIDLAPGETLLCVTDGVTERRNGDRQLDDDDGLAEILRGCVGLGAKAVAERVRRAAHDFSAESVDDDLAVLVLEAAPLPEPRRV
ncbi:SpoIIE family protein phosphatase [Streptomyces sp. NPDC088116]|uniref:SpoIIE family protein phosphatase n=1 Tax=Streptomyces sp. NPDC088116 TaxID=3365825 RepID=UPI0037FADEC0